MKLLHTADWHLNDRLGRIDRTSDLRAAVERVARYCETEKIDALIVAGDLFSELARPEALRDTIHHWQEVFGGFLQRGGTILTCTGNHDNENFCQTLRHAMNLASLGPTVPGQLVQPGRLYLATEPSFLRLAAPDQSFEVQFVLMPYPTPTRYLRSDGVKKYNNLEQKVALLNQAFVQSVDDWLAHPQFRHDQPKVMIGHANVVGAAVGESLFRLTHQEDIVITSTAFMDRFDYVALGHIHKEQTLGSEAVRYCGSIEKLDLGERNDAKSVTVFELTAQGLAGTPELLPLPSTPIYEVTILDPDVDMPRLRAEQHETQTDLVNIRLHYTAGQHQLDALLKELEEIFPRWYVRDWQEATALRDSLQGTELNPQANFAETVREYLNQELANHADEEREPLLKLAEELIAQCEAN